MYDDSLTPKLFRFRFSMARLTHLNAAFIPMLMVTASDLIIFRCIATVNSIVFNVVSILANFEPLKTLQN